MDEILGMLRSETVRAVWASTFIVAGVVQVVKGVRAFGSLSRAIGFHVFTFFILFVMCAMFIVFPFQLVSGLLGYETPAEIARMKLHIASRIESIDQELAAPVNTPDYEGAPRKYEKKAESARERAQLLKRQSKVAELRPLPSEASAVLWYILLFAPACSYLFIFIGSSRPRASRTVAPTETSSTKRVLDRPRSGILR